MKIRQIDPKPASFQLAPMIDIVFLLLTFFLVNHQMTEQEKDIEVAVPTSTEGAQKARVANEIIINLTKEGVITISGEIYTKDQLRQKLERIVEIAELQNKNGADQQPVRIRADSDGQNQTTFEVLDVIRKAGLYHIGFASRDAPKVR